MTVLATADATTVTRPASAHTGTPARTRGTRLRAVPTAPEVVPESPTRGAEPLDVGTGSVPVTLTIRIEGGGRAGSDRLLTALRDLVEAAGPDAAVLVASEAGDAVIPDHHGGVFLRGVLAEGSPGQDPDPATAARPGEIRLDPRPRTVARDGWPLHLSRLEYDLLLFLARHPRQVFSRSQLLAQVWGHTHTTNRTVDVHVSRLRNKLGDQDLVTTVYGLGYRLADDAPVTVAE
jgi:two-component system response regulator MtrA